MATDDTATTTDATATDTKRDVPQPEGETVPSGSTPSTDGFEERTAPAVDSDDEDAKKASFVKRFRALTGVKASDIISVNEQTRVIVTAQGGKYQINRKGNQVQHLQGPPVPKSVAGEELGDKYLDARAASPFTGTAALINASVNEYPSGARGEMTNQLLQDADAAEAEAERRREAAENAAR
jgi:hypothetical protein